MKKFYTTIILALISGAMFAQVSVTKATYYQPGNIVQDLYLVENDATDSVPIANIFLSPISLGNGLERVFPNYNIVDTVVYETPEQEGNINGATCCYRNENGLKLYLQTNDNNAFCLGVSGALASLGLDDNIAIAFDEPLKVAEFPIAKNSTLTSNGHGEYKDKISALQSIFNSFDATYGPLIYNMFSAEYDSIRADIQVHFTSNFDNEGSLSLVGARMLQGEYQYLRETRKYLFTVNLQFKRNNGTEFLDLNECTITNPMLQMFLGETTINIGETLSQYLGLTFPMEMPTSQILFWTNDIVAPIIEITTNETYDAAKRLAIRFGENDNEGEDGNCPHDDAVEENTINACIFPNPTTDFINIAIDNMTEGSIQIYSANGSLVKEKSLNGNFNSINVSSLKAGNYFFTITNGEKKLNGTFAKN